MENELIEIDQAFYNEKNEENLIEYLEEFFLGTKLELQENYCSYLLSEKRFFGRDIAKIYLSNDKISVTTTKEELNLVIKIFKDFTDLYPVKVQIRYSKSKEDW